MTARPTDRHNCVLEPPSGAGVDWGMSGGPS
jgi:hypothetical protein